MIRKFGVAPRIKSPFVFLLGLALVAGAIGGCSNANDTKMTNSEADVVNAPSPEESSTGSAPAFVPAGFQVPRMVNGSDFKLQPLGPELVNKDYVAYMSSIEHLQKTFSRSEGWPNESISEADAMLDMQTEERRFMERESFAYGVLSPDGERELGSLYVRPSEKPGFDAQVSMWVTKAEFDAGFDAKLYDWAQAWVSKEWPFENVAYPGRAIEWVEWDKLPQRKNAYTSNEQMVASNRATAELFIDAFYSFDAEQLRPLIAEAKASASSILYYQGWAEGGNYVVLERGPCEAVSTEMFRCPITVQDDPVVALQTGFNVTDTFELIFDSGDIVAINTSSNDQPIYYEARKWVEESMPEILTGPCAGRGDPDYVGDATAGDCARAMTVGYRRFYEATRSEG